MFSLPPHRQNGNIMVYILIAIFLFGGLTLALSRQNTQSDNQNLNDEQVLLLANEILQQSVAAQGAVDTILLAGSEIDDLVFIPPTDGNFATVDTIHNVYHPQGGGLVYKEKFNLSACAAPGMAEVEDCGIYITRNTHVADTPTGSDEVIIYFHRVRADICRALNKKLVGTEDIPPLDVALENMFITGAANLTSANCPTCPNASSLCVSDPDEENFGFYSLLAVQ